MEALLGCLRRWQPGELGRIQDRLATYNDLPCNILASLVDPINDRIERERPARLPRRSLHERRVLGVIKDQVVLDDGIDLRRAVALIDQALNLRAKGLRTRSIMSQPDTSGNRTLFRTAANFAAEIDRINDEARELSRRSPMLCAIYAMTSIAALHPYYDGNGRLSRIIFNLYIRRFFGGPYIPLYEIGQFSTGTWLLSLRRAQIDDDWHQLCGYLHATLHVCWDLQNLPATSD